MCAHVQIWGSDISEMVWTVSATLRIKLFVPDLSGDQVPGGNEDLGKLLVPDISEDKIYPSSIYFGLGYHHGNDVARSCAPQLNWDLGEEINMFSNVQFISKYENYLIPN